MRDLLLGFAVGSVVVGAVAGLSLGPLVRLLVARDRMRDAQ